jgi:hypothetical protein
VDGLALQVVRAKAKLLRLRCLSSYGGKGGEIRVLDARDVEKR